MPSKHHSMLFYSSTLEVALCKKKKKPFQRHLYKGRYTQLTCMSEACQVLRYDCQLAFYYLQQLISISFKNSCIPTFKEKHFQWKLSIKDIPVSYQQQVFPLQVFHNVRLSLHFLLHLKAYEYFNHYNMMRSPILTL